MNLIGKTRLDLSCAMKSFGRDYKNGVQTKYIYLQKYQLCMRSNYFYKGFGKGPAKYKGHVDSINLIPYFQLDLKTFSKKAQIPSNA